MVRLHAVVADADLVVEKEQLLFDCVLELLNVPEAPGVAGLQTHEVAGGGVDTVVQGDLEHLGGVDIARVGRAVRRAAARAGLDAADDGPVARLFHRAALAQGHFHGGFVVEEAGVGHARLHHLAALADQRLGGVLPDADGQHRLGRLHLGGGIQAEIAQVVGGVPAVRGLAADDEDLPHRVAGEGGGIPVVAHLVDLAGLQIEALEQLQRPAGFESPVDDDVLLIEGPQVLVKAAEAAGRGADLDVEADMHEPHKLQSLPEGLRRVFGDDAAVFGDLEKLGAARGVFAGRRLAFGLLRHAVGIGDEALALDDAGVPEVDFPLVVRAHALGRGDAGTALVHIAAQADPQQLFMVAGGLARNAVAKADRDDVLAPGLFDVRGQDAAGLVLHGAADPVLVEDADDLFTVLRRNVVGVALSDGKLVDVVQIEFLGRLELGMEIRAAVAVGGRADNQLILHDEGGHMLQDVADHLRPEHRGGVAGKAFVGLPRSAGPAVRR